MKARVVYRTHYQVEEPAFLEILLKFCTSPIQATYSERVAAQLASQISSRGRKFNVAAGGYAIDLARGLGILDGNNTWTEKGHLLALHSTVGNRDIEAELELDAAERLTHFRLFLEADGAVFLHIARVAQHCDRLPEDHDWNHFAGVMFREIYSEYLKVTADISDRLTIRKDLDRLKAPFAGRTGWHKSYIHLQTMFRLGLLSRAKSSQREYVVLEPMRASLAALVRLIPTVMVLEEIVAQRRWSEIAAGVLQVGKGPTMSVEELLHVAARIYLRVSETGVPLCSLATLVDAVQIHILASGFQNLTAREILSRLTELQRRLPRDVRFHVDRRGQPAFLKLSHELALQL